MNIDLKEKVSIIMPVYNDIKNISSAIESVINQSYLYWELIIIDDGSSLNIQKHISRYLLDERITYYRINNNIGVAGARNIGIKKAKARYLAFLDSDDIWLNNKLLKQIDFMQKNKVAFSYMQYRHFYKEINNVGNIIDVKEKISYKDLLKGNIIGCLTVMIDRKKIKDIYFSNYKHEDYILWLYILKKGFCAYGIKEDLARYRKSPNSLTGNKMKSFCWTWNVYRNSEKLSPLKSLYYLFFYIIKGIKKHL